MNDSEGKPKSMLERWNHLERSLEKLIAISDSSQKKIYQSKLEKVREQRT